MTRSKSKLVISMFVKWKWRVISFEILSDHIVLNRTISITIILFNLTIFMNYLSSTCSSNSVITIVHYIQPRVILGVFFKKYFYHQTPYVYLNDGFTYTKVWYICLSSSINWNWHPELRMWDFTFSRLMVLWY